MLIIPKPSSGAVRQQTYNSLEEIPPQDRIHVPPAVERIALHALDSGKTVEFTFDLDPRRTVKQHNEKDCTEESKVFIKKEIQSDQSVSFYQLIKDIVMGFFALITFVLKKLLG